MRAHSAVAPRRLAARSTARTAAPRRAAAAAQPANGAGAETKDAFDPRLSSDEIEQWEDNGGPPTPLLVRVKCGGARGVRGGGEAWQARAGLGKSRSRAAKPRYATRGLSRFVRGRFGRRAACPAAVPARAPVCVRLLPKCEL